MLSIAEIIRFCDLLYIFIYVYNNRTDDSLSSDFSFLFIFLYTPMVVLYYQQMCCIRVKSMHYAEKNIENKIITKHSH